MGKKIEKADSEHEKGSIFFPEVSVGCLHGTYALPWSTQFTTQKWQSSTSRLFNSQEWKLVKMGLFTSKAPWFSGVTLHGGNSKQKQRSQGTPSCHFSIKDSTTNLLFLSSALPCIVIFSLCMSPSLIQIWLLFYSSSGHHEKHLAQYLRRVHKSLRQAFQFFLSQHSTFCNLLVHFWNRRKKMVCQELETARTEVVSRLYLIQHKREELENRNTESCYSYFPRLDCTRLKIKYNKSVQSWLLLLQSKNKIKHPLTAWFRDSSL